MMWLAKGYSPIDNRLIFNQTKHPGLFVPRLRVRSNRATLYETETHLADASNGLTMLIKPSSEPDGV